MKDFIEKITSFILPDGVSFKVKEEIAGDLYSYTILVPETEIGKVIGKEGKVISAIRILGRTKASKEQKRVLIKVDCLTEA